MKYIFTPSTNNEQNVNQNKMHAQLRFWLSVQFGWHHAGTEGEIPLEPVSRVGCPNFAHFLWVTQIKGFCAQNTQPACVGGGFSAKLTIQHAFQTFCSVSIHTHSSGNCYKLPHQFCCNFAHPCYNFAHPLFGMNKPSLHIVACLD